MKSALNWAVHVDLSLRFSSTSSSTNAKLARWFPSSVLARCRLRFAQQSVSGVPPSATVTAERVKTEKAQRSTKVARLSALKFVPRVGSILRVDFVDLQWIHDKIQRPFTCGRRLQDVVIDTILDVLLPSDLHMVEIVHRESKWFSRHNRRCGLDQSWFFCMGWPHNALSLSL